MLLVLFQPEFSYLIGSLMKNIAVLLFLLPSMVNGQDLVPMNNPELATVLGLLQELAITPPTSGQPHIVRVYTSPIAIGECDGIVMTCPDVRLFVTVSTGDIGETPVLYELPTQKGWEFKGWSSPVNIGGTSMASFVLHTTLPDANIQPAARKAWRPQEYRVLVSPTSASYIQRFRPNNLLRVKPIKRTP